MKNDGIVPEDGKLDNKENENQNHEGASDKGGEKMIPKSRLDQEISKRKEADKAIEAVANELLEDIPEYFRDIVPDLPRQKRSSGSGMLKRKDCSTRTTNRMDRTVNVREANSLRIYRTSPHLN